MRTHRLASLLVVLAACSGDDGVNHLADAPVLPIDAPADAAIDSPDPMITLTTTVAGSGTGTVTSSPAGISCTSGTCTGDFDPNTVVTLTAVAGTGSVFVGWSGACTGTTPTCDVTLAQAATVTATFDLAKYAVTVTKSGAGMGTVTGNGINCGATCTVMVDHGTALSLTATPANLSVFAGWGGACSGNASCMVTVTGPTTISASFPLDTLTLFVTRGGNGAGTVTATGINCGADCDETYTAGQMVTLTAAPTTGSTFTGWTGGGCSGTGTCTVTITAATTVTATFTLQQFALTVTKAGNGNGSVVSSPTGIACGTDCMESYNYNAMVTLTATPSMGSSFTGWSGACTGTAMCVVTMTQARSVTATFSLQQFALTTTVTGNGTVTSAPAGISCPGDCTESYDFGQTVTLTAAAGVGSSFAGWSGACTNTTGACTVTIDAAKAVTATFTLNQYTLTVAKAGNGTGTVTGTGITCGVDCSETVNFGTMITLTPTAAMGSTFAGWTGGGCTGQGACTVTVAAATTVTATFNLQTFTLTTVLAGNGTGTVTSSPAGITCGSDCSELYNYNQMVTLTAAAGTGSTFMGWSGGGCSGTAPCVVTVTAATSVTATFTLMQLPLMVTKGGGGTGTVTSSPAGINCGTTCMQNIDHGTMVTLTAAASSPSSTFGGWSGACTGTGTCTVTMTQARSVTATFDVATYALTVTRAGAGGGTVTSSPIGINCPGTCSSTYNYNTSVTLTATPDASSTFAGWSGAGCMGAGICIVPMTQAQNVTATFNVKTLRLTVTRSGDGVGAVTGNGINCGGTCQVTLAIGTTVSLTATPDTVNVNNLSTFTGWSGGCTGTGACTFAIMADTTIDASFKMNPNLMFTTSVNYNGNLGGVAGADAKCQGLATARGLVGTYRAFISATNLDAPVRFVNASGWVRTDGKPMVNAIGEFGTATLTNAPLIDEGGNVIADAAARPGAWTATQNGTYTGANCNTAAAGSDWTVQDVLVRAMTGRCDATNAGVVAAGTAGCSVSLHLYCFGVDRRASVP